MIARAASRPECRRPTAPTGPRPSVPSPCVPSRSSGSPGSRSSGSAPVTLSVTAQGSRSPSPPSAPPRITPHQQWGHGCVLITVGQDQDERDLQEADDQEDSRVIKDSSINSHGSQLISHSQSHSQQPQRPPLRRVPTPLDPLLALKSSVAVDSTLPLNSGPTGSTHLHSSTSSHSPTTLTLNSCADSNSDSASRLDDPNSPLPTPQQAHTSLTGPVSPAPAQLAATDTANTASDNVWSALSAAQEPEPKRKQILDPTVTRAVTHPKAQAQAQARETHTLTHEYDHETHSPGWHIRASASTSDRAQQRATPSLALVTSLSPLVTSLPSSSTSTPTGYSLKHTHRPHDLEALDVPVSATQEYFATHSDHSPNVHAHAQGDTTHSPSRHNLSHSTHPRSYGSYDDCTTVLRTEEYARAAHASVPQLEPQPLSSSSVTSEVSLAHSEDPSLVLSAPDELQHGPREPRITPAHPERQGYHLVERSEPEPTLRPPEPESYCRPSDSTSTSAGRSESSAPAPALSTGTSPTESPKTAPVPSLQRRIDSSSTPSTSTLTTPTQTSAHLKRRPSLSKSLSILRDSLRPRTRSFSDEGHEPSSLPPVPPVPSVFLDPAQDSTSNSSLNTDTTQSTQPSDTKQSNFGTMSLLRKMTKKRDKSEKVTPPAQARGILAEMAQSSEQLRRRPTINATPTPIPNPHQQPPLNTPSGQSGQPGTGLGLGGSSAARNVLKEMGAASEQIRARPPGSHPGRPGPRHRPRRERQGTFEAIVVGQTPRSDSDEEIERPGTEFETWLGAERTMSEESHDANADTLAKLTGSPVAPIAAPIAMRRAPSPASPSSPTDSSSASTPPEGVLGLEIDPSALRMPLGTVTKEMSFVGLAYDAPSYGSSPSEYGGEDLIDSYFDRSPEPAATEIRQDVPPMSIGTVASEQKQVAPGHFAPGQIVPGQVMPSQVMPRQAMPGQIAPGQVMPTHYMPTQRDARDPIDDVDDHTAAFLASRPPIAISEGHGQGRAYGSESGHSSSASHARRACSDLGHGSQASQYAASIRSHASVRARPEHAPMPDARSRSSSRAHESESESRSAHGHGGHGGHGQLIRAKSQRSQHSERGERSEPSDRRDRNEHGESGERALSRQQSQRGDRSERNGQQDRNGDKEREGLFRKASQLGHKLSTKNKWAADRAPPLPSTGPPTSFDLQAIRQAEARQAEMKEGLERKSCKPTIHTNASLAAEIGMVRNKDDAAQMEALFLV